jgi:hypothetical protein
MNKSVMTSQIILKKLIEGTAYPIENKLDEFKVVKLPRNQSELI